MKSPGEDERGEKESMLPAPSPPSGRLPISQKQTTSDFHFGVSLFAKWDRLPTYDFAFVDHFEPDLSAEEAAARGYTFIGTVSVIEGSVSVQTEPGFESPMIHGVYALMGRFGERLKAHQLSQKAGV